MVGNCSSCVVPPRKHRGALDLSNKRQTEAGQECEAPSHQARHYVEIMRCGRGGMGWCPYTPFQ